MVKYVLFFLLAITIGILVAAPKTPTEVKQRREKHQQQLTSTGMTRIQRFEWEGHSYIAFYGGTYSGRHGVVHDPDCPCNKIIPNE